MSTDAVAVAASDWDMVLARIERRDAYLLKGWLDACAIIEHGVPVMLHVHDAGGDVVLPMLLRDIPGADGCRDAVTPYGYGGPIASGTHPPVEAFHAAALQWMRDQRIVSLFVRFHPLYQNAPLALPGTDVVQLAGTAGWNLAPGRDLEAAMHQRHRRLVRKARREGVEVRVEVVPAAASLDAFRALYDETMHRQQAADFYFFPDEYWQTLEASLGESLLLVRATIDDEPAAELLMVATHPFLHYHLGASSEAGRQVGASNLCFLTAAMWGQQHGFDMLHLGGGVGGSADSLLDFKLRFDPNSEPLPLHIGKLIVDADAYRNLSGTTSTDGFFPAYRQRD